MEKQEQPENKRKNPRLGTLVIYRGGKPTFIAAAFRQFAGKSAVSGFRFPIYEDLALKKGEYLLLYPADGYRFYLVKREAVVPI